MLLGLAASNEESATGPPLLLSLGLLLRKLAVVPLIMA